MQVSKFMIPANKVVTVLPEETIQTVMVIMMTKRIGTVVVVDEDTQREATLLLLENENKKAWLPMPLGIITKSDIMKAYQDGVPIDASCKEIMHPASAELKTCTPNMSRNEVSKILNEIKTHHLIVVDDRQPNRFVGILSSFDIASDCANGGFQWNPFKQCSKIADEPIIETEADRKESILHHKHNKVTYEDYLDVQGIW